jgi:hypothetical protein
MHSLESANILSSPASTLPLESERAQKAYGVSGSAVNKLLIINKEIKPGRINLILINQVIGF